jgi:hypothetical protein
MLVRVDAPHRVALLVSSLREPQMFALRVAGGEFRQHNPPLLAKRCIFWLEQLASTNLAVQAVEPQ